MEPFEGPHVTVASFCRTGSNTPDGALSISGLGSRIFVTDGALVVGVQPAFAVGIDAGLAYGRHSVRLEHERPDGHRSEMLSAELDLTIEHPAWYRVFPGPKLFSHGLHWVHVLVNGTRASSTPFRLVLRRGRSN